MALHRRTLLHVATGIGVGLPGCSNIEGTDKTPTGTPTDSPDPNPEAQDIHLVIHNEISQSITVSVELTSGGTALLEDQTTIRPSEFAGFDTGIDETGEYTLRVAVDDRVEESTIDIGEFAIDSGSNIIVRVFEDEIQYLTED